MHRKVNIVDTEARMVFLGGHLAKYLATRNCVCKFLALVSGSFDSPLRLHVK